MNPIKGPMQSRQNILHHQVLCLRFPMAFYLSSVSSLLSSLQQHYPVKVAYLVPLAAVVAKHHFSFSYFVLFYVSPLAMNT